MTRDAGLVTRDPCWIFFHPGERRQGTRHSWNYLGILENLLHSLGLLFWGMGLLSKSGILQKA